MVINSKEEYESCTFPVWSSVNGQDDIVWYPAEKDENGDWVCQVDITSHNSVGEFIIHAYNVSEQGVLGNYLDATMVIVPESETS